MGNDPVLSPSLQESTVPLGHQGGVQSWRSLTLCARVRVHSQLTLFTPSPCVHSTLLTPWTSATRVTYCFTLNMMSFFPRTTLVKLDQCLQDKEESSSCTVPKWFVWTYKSSEESRHCIWIVWEYENMCTWRTCQRGLRYFIPGVEWVLINHKGKLVHRHMKHNYSWQLRLFKGSCKIFVFCYSNWIRLTHTYRFYLHSLWLNILFVVLQLFVFWWLSDFAHLHSLRLWPGSHWYFTFVNWYISSNDCIERHILRFFTISSLRCELFPVCTLKWPGRNHVQIMCNTLSAYCMQHVVCLVVQRGSSAAEFDRV